jgi:folylpolyglutamate synthase/dihydropteroate synthase
MHADSISDALELAVASDAELARKQDLAQPVAKRAKSEDEGLDDDGSIEHHIMITGSLHLVGGALSILGCDVE